MVLGCLVTPAAGSIEPVSRVLNASVGGSLGSANQPPDVLVGSVLGDVSHSAALSPPALPTGSIALTSKATTTSIGLSAFGAGGGAAFMFPNVTGFATVVADVPAFDGVALAAFDGFSTNGAALPVTLIVKNAADVTVFTQTQLNLLEPISLSAGRYTFRWDVQLVPLIGIAGPSPTSGTFNSTIFVPEPASTTFVGGILGTCASCRRRSR